LQTESINFLSQLRAGKRDLKGTNSKNENSPIQKPNEKTDVVILIPQEKPKEITSVTSLIERAETEEDSQYIALSGFTKAEVDIFIILFTF
jgi:hypothetical protein